MSNQIGEVSADGFWVLTEDGWQPTAQQEQALAEGATPHDSTPVSVLAGTTQSMEPQMVTIDGNYSPIQMGVVTTVPYGVPMQVTGVGRPFQMMGFSDAVVKALKNYANFSGRSSRSEYWWFALFVMFVNFCSIIIDTIVLGIPPNEIGVFYIICYLALFMPTIAVGVRRMHDHGMSGWFLLVPIYGFILAATEGEALPNAFGPIPTNVLD